MDEPEIPRRDVLQEGRQALRLMEEAYPRLLALTREHGPEFAAAEAQNSIARNRAESDGIRQQYGDFREATLDASPELALANESIGDRFRELGASPIERELQTQALDELRLGDQLSPEDTRLAIQTARAGASARGLARSAATLASEVLTRQRFGDRREAERRQFAGGVDQLSTARRGADATIANNLSNTQRAYWDPQNRLYGAGGSAVSGQVNPSAPLIPFLSASQDVASSNQEAAYRESLLDFDRFRFDAQREDTEYYFDRNAEISAQNAADQRRSANRSGALRAGGSIAAAAIMAFL